MIQLPHAPPFNNLMKPALIYTLTFLITQNSRSQKNLHIILSKWACQSTTPPVPEGKMRVVGIKAVKIVSTKAVLIVAFTLTNPGANNFLTLAFAASHAQRQHVA